MEMRPKWIWNKDPIKVMKNQTPRAKPWVLHGKMAQKKDESTLVQVNPARNSLSFPPCTPYPKLRAKVYTDKWEIKQGRANFQPPIKAGKSYGHKFKLPSIPTQRIPSGKFPGSALHPTKKQLEKFHVPAPTPNSGIWINPTFLVSKIVVWFQQIQIQNQIQIHPLGIHGKLGVFTAWAIAWSGNDLAPLQRRQI